jgi:hypothetical protein
MWPAASGLETPEVKEGMRNNLLPLDFQETFTPLLNICNFIGAVFCM